MPTSCNIAQHGVLIQTKAICCAQHVAFVCTGLKPFKRLSIVSNTFEQNPNLGYDLVFVLITSPLVFLNASYSLL